MCPKCGLNWHNCECNDPDGLKKMRSPLKPDSTPFKLGYKAARMHDSMISSLALTSLDRLKGTFEELIYEYAEMLARKGNPGEQIPTITVQDVEYAMRNIVYILKESNLPEELKIIFDKITYGVYSYEGDK